ncbi:hypothetical protein OIU80_11745 [Flavobacterium sp. LS1R47]|uniref:Uncharacterized protein n=1 Tax=Flavobacterium frigoritolerans TaxID=2987686 RepID=A0A9X3C6Z0_9FLAO|nr:hypothetical protein [Flavobacterium frigoritolerans]MCV9932954.1 hypothetical protein [Flavobacterium frigoritolerans]
MFVLFILNFKSGIKIVTVTTEILFDNFIMTKELKRVEEKEFNTREIRLNSLCTALQFHSISEQSRQILMERFILEKEELAQFNPSFIASESSKNWSRIQNYTEEFSKENRYQLIIGSENRIPVLYVQMKELIYPKICLST